MQCFSLTVHPREIQGQSSSTRCGSVKLLLLVPAPRVKPERQKKEMEHRSGTFFRESLYMHRGSASRIVLRDESRIVEQQKQQHSSSSTAAAAQQQQHSSSGGGDVELLFLVPAPRVKPERQMKKMEHRSGTFFRDSLHITAVCIADQHCGS